MMPFKQMATLSGNLLARKGNAMPASLGGLPPHPMMPQRLDGWLPPPVSPGPTPPRRPAPAAIEAPALRKAEGPPPPKTPKKGIKVSLRLDEDRHLKLRLAAAHQHRSGQEIVLAALDAYLKTCAAAVMEGNCACLKRPAGA